EPESLEQHAAALAALRHPVQATVEIEVLERGQLAVDERLVPEEADPLAGQLDLQFASGRDEQSRDQPEQRRLAGAVRPGQQQEPTAADLEVEIADHVL